MISILVLSHGDLALHLLEAASRIDPHLAERSEALPLSWEVDSGDAAQQLEKRLKEMQSDGEGVLVLTDMFGGTATNIALPRLEPDKVEVVTGANLPMLLRLGTLRGRGMTLHDMAERAVAAGQKSIHVASDFLKTRRDPTNSNLTE